jgi:hypothetical protein
MIIKVEIEIEGNNKTKRALDKYLVEALYKEVLEIDEAVMGVRIR